MRYIAMTTVLPVEVLQRAKDFYGAHTRLKVGEETSDSVTFRGAIGAATIRVGREHGHTTIHASTDRVVGLDVTDITKRFLYTLSGV
jgi:hypothetical protein